MQNKKNSWSGHNKETIMLTYDCSKMLSMMSKSPKSFEIRKYYLEIEKIIINNFINGL